MIFFRVSYLTLHQEQQDESRPGKILSKNTSPAMNSQSPRLSLFPSAESSRTPSPRTASAVRALQRSMTAPAKSPLRQTFSRAISSETTKQVAPVPSKPVAAPAVKSPIPTRVDSLDAFKESATKTLSVAQHGTAPSAVTPTPPTVKAPQHLARTASQRQPHVTKLSALSSHPSSAPLDTTSPLQRLQSLSSPSRSARETRVKGNQSSGTGTANETHTQKEPAAKPVVGIARSVSVSRANSPRSLVRTATDAGATRSPQSERLMVKRALTPTMVEVRNRHSQRVQLVDM